MDGSRRISVHENDLSTCLHLIDTHIDDRRGAIPGVDYIVDIHLTWAAVQVSCDPSRKGSVIPGVDGGRGSPQAQVPVVRVHEQRVGIDIARTRVSALDVAVGDSRRAGHIENLNFWHVSPQYGIRQRRVAVIIVHPTAIAAGRIATEDHVGEGRIAAIAVVHPPAGGGRVANEGDI